MTQRHLASDPGVGYTSPAGVAPSASARGPTAHEQRPGHCVARHCGTLSFVKICRAFARSVGLFRPGVVRGDRVSSGECDPWLRITRGHHPGGAQRHHAVRLSTRECARRACQFATKRLLHMRIGSLHVGRRTSPACDPVDGPTRLSSPVVWGPSSSPCPVALAPSRR
jgi:hypothetical protein